VVVEARAVGVADVDGFTPWCYRHHNILRRLARDAGSGRYGASVTTATWARHSHTTLQILCQCLESSSRTHTAVRSALRQAARLLPSAGADDPDGAVGPLTAGCGARRVAHPRPAGRPTDARTTTEAPRTDKDCDE